MKYGVFSVSMPEYNPEETLKILKELGYDGVEWRVTNMPKEKPENIRRTERQQETKTGTLCFHIPERSRRNRP